MATFTSFNRALNQIPRRAESQMADQLRETFVDSGVAAALDVIDNQVLYGRRGTGKTHALSYLGATRAERGDIGIYLDLRTVGSASGIYEFETVSAVERTGRILIDMLNQVHDSLLKAALDDDQLVTDERFIQRLDALLGVIARVRVVGPVATTVERSNSASRDDKFNASIKSGPSISVDLGVSTSASNSFSAKEIEARSGDERTSLNFSDIARSLRELVDSMSARRIWLLLDEWSSLPRDVQPYFGSFLVRCITPLNTFTVKIAAIEQQTQFRKLLSDGSFIGIELGADFAANVNLDEFMVFEQDAARAREFFRGLLFKHLTAGIDETGKIQGLDSETGLIPLGFTSAPVFDELVRAAEGVPRDAINIAAKAAFKARESKISMPDIRIAARQWYQSDKEGALRGVSQAHELLYWVIDKVIRQKRARGFLVNQRSAESSLLTALFDARVLHLVRRGYSSQEAPGERYDVYAIDYGAYVDLINTKNAPQEMPSLDDETAGWTEVPAQDLRALRRAILNLDEFAKSIDPLPTRKPHESTRI